MSSQLSAVFAKPGQTGNSLDSTLFPFFLLRNVCLTFTEIPDTKPEMPDARLAIQ